MTLELEFLRIATKDLAAGLGDDDDIFDADGADVGVVQSGFDCDHTAGFQNTVRCIHTQRFIVECQSQAVTRAVKETD